MISATKGTGKKKTILPTQRITPETARLFFPFNPVPDYPSLLHISVGAHFPTEALACYDIPVPLYWGNMSELLNLNLEVT